MEIQELYQLFKNSTGICTDTRHLQKGQLFFALKGGNFNGNLFAASAIENGASYAIVDEATVTTHNRHILVNDALSTLQELAAYHRMQMKIPVLAITGSNGKTTTKELIHKVLSKKFQTLATIGNLNNHIGVPLTLLRITEQTEIAIIEMGANHVGEINDYCQWTQPNFGLITNIGLAHLEGFGGPEGVKKGKSELYSAVKKNEGLLFLNKDDEVLNQLVAAYSKVFTYGASDDAEVQGKIFNSNEKMLQVTWKENTIQTNLSGNYNFMNIMSAIAIGVFFKVEELDIVNAIQSYYPDNNRSQIKNIGTNTFILDAYNANPSSLKLAIENFAQLNSTNKKMIIIGEMKEMGAYSKEMHLDLVTLIRKYKFDQIVLVGNEFQGLLEEQEGLYFENSDGAKAWWQHATVDNYTILLKGSRGIALEKILEA
jgi:UDP-N-acetylmuramoyl-tripeptide--D-alanyl-D-alanine ligase